MSVQLKWIYVVCALAVVAAFAMFFPSRFYFLNDDLVHIPLSAEGVLFQRQSFRPIADLSIRLDYLIYGKNATGYHITNLVLHAVCSVFVGLLAKSLLSRYVKSVSNSEPLIAATLFFVYAMHSESVVWILGRSASLGAIFFLPALLLYLQKDRSAVYYLLSLVLMELGLLAYESVWIFPILAFIVAIAERRIYKKPFAVESRYLAGVFTVFAGHLLIRFLVIKQVAASYEAAAFLQGDLYVLLVNFGKLFLRSFVPPFTSSSTFIACSAVFVIAATIGGLLWLKSPKFKQTGTYVALLLSCFVISLFPYLSLGIDTHGVEGERYLYLPTVFACLVLSKISQKIIATFAGLFCIVCFFALQLFFLSRATSAYQVASKISFNSFEQLNALAGKKRLFIDSLPQANKGALIFRSGFYEGVLWLKNMGTVDSVFVLSIKRDNNSYAKEYAVAPKTVYPTHSLVPLESYPQNGMPASSKHQQPLKFNPQTDAYFIYDSATINIFK